MKPYHRITLQYMAMLLVIGFSPAAAQGAPKGKISRNIYRIPYANTQTLRIGGNDYYNHGGSMDTSIVAANGGVCVGAAGTSCATNGDCGTVGGTCQNGYCIDPCMTGFDCTPAGGTCDFVIVAPADGIVCQVIEHYNDAGCNNAYGPFANRLAILHANGEMSTFGHMKQWSLSRFGINAGMFVSQGQPVAIEGDVGKTCGGTAAARLGSCLETALIPEFACMNSFPFIECTSDADCPGNDEECRSTKTARHIHWKILRYTTNERMNPFTCGIPGNIYQPGSDYRSPCGSESPSYLANETVDGPSLSGYGEFRVTQASNTITATTIVVQNQASLVLHAGNRITLRPGFQVRRDGYFRAEIATPDSTATSTWPPPDTCPCTGIADEGYCFEWSDANVPGRVRQGCKVCDEGSLNAGELCFNDLQCNGGSCLSPGPVLAQCHGCPTLSGGNRCCPCLGQNTCQ